MKRILWSARLRSGIGGHAGGGFLRDSQGNNYVEGLFEVEDGTPPETIQAMVSARAARVVDSDWANYDEWLEENQIDIDPDNPPMHHIRA